MIIHDNFAPPPPEPSFFDSIFSLFDYSYLPIIFGAYMVYLSLVVLFIGGGMLAFIHFAPPKMLNRFFHVIEVVLAKITAKLADVYTHFFKRVLYFDLNLVDMFLGYTD